MSDTYDPAANGWTVDKGEPGYVNARKFFEDHWKHFTNLPGQIAATCKAADDEWDRLLASRAKAQQEETAAAATTGAAATAKAEADTKEEQRGLAA